MKNFIKIAILFEIVGLLFTPIIAQALPITLTFYNISGNNDVSAAIGENQARVDVTINPEDHRQVDFRFYNTGPQTMSITGIYYDVGDLFGIEEIINDPDPTHQVAFSVSETPNDLPAWNEVSPPFDTSKNFLAADSDPPVYHNGVNPGEEVTITVNLLDGISYNDIISNLSIGDPDLRIGIQVQGFANDDESESFINNPPAPVPEPCTLFIFLGLLMVGLPFNQYYKHRKKLY